MKMTLVEKSTLKKPELYVEYIQGWQKSGLPQKQYCKSVNISYAAFKYWRAKFAKDKKNAPEKFIPLVPSSATIPIKHSNPTIENQKITVITSDGIQLSFPLSVSPTTLGDYIKAMRTRP